MVGNVKEVKRLYTKVITCCDGCPDFHEGGNKLIIGIERPFCTRGEGRYLRREDGDCDGDYPSWCELSIVGD